MKKIVVLMTAALTLLSVTVTTAVADTPAFILNGLVVYDNGQGRAWLQEKTLTQDQVVVVRPGDRIGPWTLARILPGRVELEGPGGTISVPLAYGGGTNVASGAPARTAPEAMSNLQPPRGSQAGNVAPETAPPALVDAQQPAKPAPVRLRKKGAGPASPEVSSTAATPRRAPPASALESADPAVGGSRTIYFPAGDPRIRQFFGAR